MSKVEDQILFQYGKGTMLDPLSNTDLEIKFLYDPNGGPNSDRALQQAKNEGLNVVFPNDHQLFIDIDNDHSYLLFLKQMDILRAYVGVETVNVEPSKSGLPKRHITVSLVDSITELERIGLQAMMGSDRVRELLAYVQEKNGDPHPTLFLEVKPGGVLQLNSDIYTLMDDEIPF